MKKFGTARVFLLIILVCVLSVAPTLAITIRKDKITKSRLFGESSKLQGVLVVWNVDTFEGGSISKSAFLDSQVKYFEKQNKGTYVLVQNLTIEEFETKKSNSLPDVICFGAGIYNLVAPLVEEQAILQKDVLESVAGAVVQNGVTKTYPWCMGGYFFLSTQEALSQCDKEEANLCDDRFNLGYSKTIGKTTRKVSSLSLGCGDYNSAFDALCFVGDVDYSALDEKYASQTGYEAYVAFCGGNSSILLGTQRDLARLENRLSQGSVSGVVAQFLPWTDMLHCASVVKQEDATKQEYAQKFCEFLQSDIVQKALPSVNLLPISNAEIEQKGTLLDDALKELQNVNVKKLF